jgi:hypothetical protein
MEGEGDVDEGGDWSYMDCFNVSSSKTREHGFSGTLLTQSRPQNGGHHAVPNAEDSGSRGALQAMPGASRESSDQAQDDARDSDDPDMALALKVSIQEALGGGVAQPTFGAVDLVEESQEISAPSSPVPQVRHICGSVDDCVRSESYLLLCKLACITPDNSRAGADDTDIARHAEAHVLRREGCGRATQR